MTRATVWEGELNAAQRAALHPGVPYGLNRQPDVLVVGGGVIGLATAAACRRAGLGSVVVIERAEQLASAASGGNGGAIAPDMHALTDSPEFVALGRASLVAYRRLDAEWDGAIGLRRRRTALPSDSCTSCWSRSRGASCFRVCYPRLHPPRSRPGPSWLTSGWVRCSTRSPSHWCPAA